MIVAVIACFPVAKLIKKLFDKTGTVLQTAAAVCLTLFLLAALFTDTTILVKTHSSNNPFLYWQF